MAFDDSLTASSLEHIAVRALTFQRYVFRRAWGSYYAVWAAAYVLFAFIQALPFQAMLPSNLVWVPYALIYGGAGWAAGLATFWIFRNARRTLSLQKTMDVHFRREGRNFALMWLWWVAFYAIVLASFVLFPERALSILFALLSSVEIFIYYGLKISFQKEFPLEGKIALVSYGACIASSFLLSFLTNNSTIALSLIGITWGVTIALWLFCALYALKSAPEELVELRHW